MSISGEHQVDRPAEDRGNPLGAGGARRVNVGSLGGGVCPAVDVGGRTWADDHVLLRRQYQKDAIKLFLATNEIQFKEYSRLTPARDPDTRLYIINEHVHLLFVHKENA